MESTPTKQESSSTVGWPVGEFYVPGFSSDGRTAFVPGAADTHRRFFLVRAAMLEPKLLSSLRETQDSEPALSAWARRWNLRDQWCQLLAQDTLRWWRSDPAAHGWEFERVVTIAGMFPFRIDPVQFGPFYYDPSWHRRQQFQKWVTEQVRR